MKTLQEIFAPQGKIDVIIDTDLYNEVDDYFATSMLFGHRERFCVKGVTIAPFFNARVTSIAEGIEKGTQELEKLLALLGETSFTDYYQGGPTYLKDEQTPVPSAAADYIIQCSQNYDEDHRLYVIGIAAITNIASALLKDPTLENRIAVVWLGGHAEYVAENKEFNLIQDVAAIRAVLKTSVPFLQVPCTGGASVFTTGYYELEHFLKGKNPLCDMLFEKTAVVAMEECKVPTWSRVLWDVVAVAALLDEKSRWYYMYIVQKNRKLPAYETGHYETEIDGQMLCVESVYRDYMMNDLFTILQKF